MPVTFESILGQTTAIDWLKQSWINRRLPHGLVFEGPAGVGKMLTARDMGTLFLCHQPEQAMACGTCESCRLMQATTHPDFSIVHRLQIRQLPDKQKSAARDLSVHVIREFLVKIASNTPMLNQGRVFVIEDAQLMSTAAQNALLKTLEEPHGKTLIILLCDDAQSLLQTIRSRTQLLRFARLDNSLVEHQLIARQIEPALAKNAAQLAQGSIGQALRLINEDVIPIAMQLIDNLNRMLAHQPMDDLPALFKEAGDAYVAIDAKRQASTSEAQARRNILTLLFEMSADHLRLLLPTKAGTAHYESICQAIDHLVQADQYLAANVTVSVVLQQLSLKFRQL